MAPARGSAEDGGTVATGATVTPLTPTKDGDVLIGTVSGTDAQGYVTGTTAAQVDFRGLLVAIKAAVLNVLSIAASYGVVAVLQWGWGGPALGVSGTGPGPAAHRRRARARAGGGAAQGHAGLRTSMVTSSMTVPQCPIRSRQTRSTSTAGSSSANAASRSSNG